MTPETRKTHHAAIRRTQQAADELVRYVRSRAEELQREFVERRALIARACPPGQGYCPIDLRVRMGKTKPTIAWTRKVLWQAETRQWVSRQVRRENGSARKGLHAALKQVAPEFQDLIMGIEDELEELLPAAETALTLARLAKQLARQLGSDAPQGE